jgi:hypothetical protein
MSIEKIHDLLWAEIQAILNKWILNLKFKIFNPFFNVLILKLFRL